jgi:hypothetical protein
MPLYKYELWLPGGSKEQGYFEAADQREAEERLPSSNLIKLLELSDSAAQRGRAGIWMKAIGFVVGGYLVLLSFVLPIALISSLDWSHQGLLWVIVGLSTLPLLIGFGRKAYYTALEQERAQEISKESMRQEEKKKEVARLTTLGNEKEPVPEWHDFVVMERKLLSLEEEAILCLHALEKQLNRENAAAVAGELLGRLDECSASSITRGRYLEAILSDKVCNLIRHTIIQASALDHRVFGLVQRYREIWGDRYAGLSDPGYWDDHSGDSLRDESVRYDWLKDQLTNIEREIGTEKKLANEGTAESLHHGLPPVRFRCPKCGLALRAPADGINKKAKCNGCQCVFWVRDQLA